MSERRIPDPGFAGDDGTAEPSLVEALETHDRTGEGYADALAMLCRARLLVPVVALLGEVEYDDRGRPVEKTSDMAAVLLQNADGRRALLAFTSMDALRAWDPESRPVPVSCRTAALSAAQEHADALVVDVAGPATFVVEGEDLGALARGWSLVRLEDGRWGWVTDQST